MWSSAYADVELEKIVARDEAAEVWGDGSWRFDRSSSADEGWLPTGGGSGFAQWVWQRTGEQLGLRIEDYRGAIRAAWVFRTDDPARFEESGSNVSGAAADTLADEYKLYCFDTSIGRCDTRVYWARFGQYLVRITYSHGGAWTGSSDEFLSYIARAEAYIESYFKSAESAAK